MSKKVLVVGSGLVGLNAAVTTILTKNLEDVEIISPNEAKQLSSSDNVKLAGEKSITLEYTNPYKGIENKITKSTPKSGQQLRRERRAALRAKNKKRP